MEPVDEECSIFHSLLLLRRLQVVRVVYLQEDWATRCSIAHGRAFLLSGSFDDFESPLGLLKARVFVFIYPYQTTQTLQWNLAYIIFTPRGFNNSGGPRNCISLYLLPGLKFGVWLARSQALGVRHSSVWPASKSNSTMPGNVLQPLRTCPCRPSTKSGL